MARIAIIGAGMAALGALAVFNHHGHQVELFEKSRGTGGRMASKRGQSASWDMGAQFMKANTPAFAAILADWHQQGLIEPWKITPWLIDEDDARPSPDDDIRYVAVPRMTALSRTLAEKASALHTSTRITALHRHDQHWTLESETGDLFDGFDAVVVTTPPAQAEPFVRNSVNLQQACLQSSMLPCWALLLAFDEPLATPFDAAFVHTGAISWLARNNSKPGRDSGETWVVLANHEWSQNCIDHTRPWVEQQLLQAFWNTTGLDALKARESWLHRWLYAFPDNSADTRGYQLDPQQKLVLCGDWLQSASIEGAWLSGQAAATALQAQLSNSRVTGANA